MIDYFKIFVASIIGGVLVLVGSAILHVVSQPASSPSAGATTAANVTTVSNPWIFGSVVNGITASFKLGTTSTAQVNQVVTSCSMIANNASVGTTTQYAYCTGVTGIVSTDVINASFATSSTLASDQWVITGAKASSTPGVIDFRLLKLTGVAASQAMSAVTTIGSSTVIRAGH